MMSVVEAQEVAMKISDLREAMSALHLHNLYTRCAPSHAPAHVTTPVFHFTHPAAHQKRAHRPRYSLHTLTARERACIYAAVSGGVCCDCCSDCVRCEVCIGVAQDQVTTSCFNGSESL
jgi:hypothetical protein